MIYLDNAATTLQKPPAVPRAASYAMCHMATPGRGGHAPAMLAADTAFACRQAAAELFQVEGPEQVVFTFNATHALNIAIKSLVKPGDTVLISGYEHNAVTRPLHALGADIRVASGPLFEPGELMESFRSQLKGVSCVICNHVSNVFGYILPVERMAALCRAGGIPLILDASQSAGCLPVSLAELGAAFIAMPGHKGLYGPQGTGLLLCAAQTRPLLEGGTGSASACQEMPDFLPDRLEAGTHNMPGIAGLLAGIRFVRQVGIDRIAQHEKELTQYAVSLLEKEDCLKLYTEPGLAYQTGVLSFTADGRDVEEIGERLADEGIAVRAGLQCAPLAHKTAGTLETGTVRFSTSYFNKKQQVNVFFNKVHEIIRVNTRF